MSACNRNISAERRRLVVLATSVGSFSTSSAVISRHHPRVAAVGMGIVVALLVWVIVAMVRLRRKESGEGE